MDTKITDIKDTIFEGYNTIIFDLDGVLLECFTSNGTSIGAYATNSPYKLVSSSTIQDIDGNFIRLQKDIRTVLKLINNAGINMGIVSSGEKEETPFAAQPSVLLLRKFQLFDYFNYCVILSRAANYENKKRSYVKPFGKTLFIDDNEEQLQKVVQNEEIDILSRNAFKEWSDLFAKKTSSLNLTTSNLIIKQKDLKFAALPFAEDYHDYKQTLDLSPNQNNPKSLTDKKKENNPVDNKQFEDDDKMLFEKGLHQTMDQPDFFRDIVPYGSLKFHSWKVVNDFEEFENLLKQRGYSYHIDGLNLIVDEVGSVYLYSLISLPENIQFNNKGFIDLSSLTTLPENIQFNNEGEVHLDALTLLPENKYEIFKNRGKVYYGLNGDNWMEFNPNIREASLKFVSKDLSDAQKEAGNYKKDHIRKDGFDITIENKKGSIRSGKDNKGKEWSVKMKHDYGYLKETIGKDKDHLDVTLADNYKENQPVFIVNQLNDNGNFDEHKVMMGFTNKEEAEKSYLDNYEKGWDNYRNIIEMSMKEFKEWSQNKKETKKELKENTEENIFICFWGPEKIAEEYNHIKNLDEELHVTLLYVPKPKLDEKKKKEILKNLSQLVKEFNDVTCQTMGLAAFNNDDKSDVALIEMTRGAELHTQLQTVVESVIGVWNKKYDFVPHMTLQLKGKGKIDLKDFKEIKWKPKFLSVKFSEQEQYLIKLGSGEIKESFEKKATLNTKAWAIIPGEIRTYEDFKKLIEYAEINKKYDLTNFYFKSFTIDFDPDYGYSWSLTRDYKISGGGGYVYPGDGNIATAWKKESSAKFNLIKYVEWLFNSETGEYSYKKSSLKFAAAENSLRGSNL